MRIYNSSKEQAAQVRKATKRVHYTVTPIGGKAELDQWKLDQKRLEDEYQAKMAPIRAARAAEVASNLTWVDGPHGTGTFAAVTRPELTEVEAAELEYQRRRIQGVIYSRVESPPIPGASDTFVPSKTFLQRSQDAMIKFFSLVFEK